MSAVACPHCGGSLAILKAANQPEPKKPTEAKADLKLVTCNRCGEENLCWQESKNGKFYLCKARIEDGRVIPLRKEFHVCNA
jgi:ribosomal protein S27E